MGGSSGQRDRVAVSSGLLGNLRPGKQTADKRADEEMARLPHDPTSWYRPRHGEPCQEKKFWCLNFFDCGRSLAIIRWLGKRLTELLLGAVRRLASESIAVGCQSVIVAAPGQQLVVSAFLDEDAVLQHQDAMGLTGKRKGVGDQDRRPPCQHLRQTCL
jgi:hypothetical protein